MFFIQSVLGHSTSLECWTVTLILEILQGQSPSRDCEVAPTEDSLQ